MDIIDKIIGAASDAKVSMHIGEGKIYIIEIKECKHSYQKICKALKLKNPRYDVDDRNTSVIREHYPGDDMRCTLFFDMNTKSYKKMIIWL